jgi:hypothetical protein
MLQTLSSGMQRIALPEAARGEFLDTCFALQTAAMRGVAASAPLAGDVPEMPAKPQAASVAPASSELRIGTQLLKIFDLAGARMTGRYRQALVHTGDWMAFRWPTISLVRTRSCISATAGNCCLPSGLGFCRAAAPGDHRLRSGRRPVSTGFLFMRRPSSALTPKPGSA